MSTLWRRIKSPLAILSVFLLLLLAILCFLLFTQAGSTVLIHTITDVASKQVAGLSVEAGATRPLATGLHLDRVRWSSDTIDVAVDDLDIVLSRRCQRPVLLCIKLVNVAKLSLEPKAGVPQNQPDSTIELPSIRAPLPLAIEKLAIHAINYNSFSSSGLLHNLRWQAEDVYWLRHTVNIGKSLIRNAHIEYRLAGKIKLHADYGLTFNNRLALHMEAFSSPITLDAELSNNVRNLRFDLNLTQPSVVHVSGQLQPLANELPFSAQLQAESINAQQWLNAEIDVGLHELDVKVAGSLQAYRIAGKASITGPQAYREQLQVNAKGTSTVLRVDDVRLGNDKAGLALQGEIKWQDQLKGNFSLNASNFSTQSLLDYPVDNFNGNATANFNIDSNNSSAHYTLNIPRLQATLREQAYTLSADISAQWPQSIDFKTLKLNSKDNRLQASAHLPAALLLAANNSDKFYQALRASRINSKFEINDFSVIDKNMQGQLAGTIRSRIENGRTKSFDADIRANEVQMQSLRLSAANANVSVATAANAPSIFTALMQNLDYNGEQVTQASVDLTGTLQQHSLQLAANLEKLALQASAGGGVFEQDNKLLGWRGAVQSFTAQHKKISQLALQNPTTVEWLGKPAKVALAPFCILADAAKLCSSAIDYRRENLDASLTLTNFNVQQLQGLLPEDISWSGMLEGEAALTIRPSQPLNINARFSGSSGRIKTWNDEQMLELPYEKLALTSLLQDEHLNVDFLLDAGSAGKAEVNMQLNGTDFKRLDANAKISKFPLGLFQPFVPAAEQFEAQLNADLSAGGTLMQPELSGVVSLQDGLIRLRSSRFEISDIAIEGNFERNKLLVEGQLNVGDNPAKIDGTLTYDEELMGQLSLKGNALHIKNVPVIDIYTDLDLQANIEKNLLMLSGSIHVPKGKITLREVPTSAVVLSPDVVFVDQAAAAKNASVWDVNTKLDVSIGENFKFSGFGATTNLAGQLAIEQKNQNPATASGSIDVIDGRYRKFGQKLDVRRGQLLFAGPLSQPDINLEAIRTVDDTIVGLKVTGDANAPQITPFSEPAMDDNTILYMLVSGKKPGAAAEEVDTSTLVAQALLSSSIRGSSNTVTSTAEQLGITDFSIGTGDDTDLQVSGYLHPNIYVEYGVGLLEEGNAFKMRWDFAKRLALVFASGLQSSVDLIYSIKF
ncbi:MAG: translocation/assembly module TamB domain-containing protein [Pseudomonadales bacterium]